MKRWLLIAIAAFATAGFVALGVWQVERRAWKLALIERVEQRVHAAPVAAPGPAEWPALTRENAEYRHVTLTGRFLEGRDTRVRAVTELGEGFWLIAPLQTEDGFTVLVNRGFVPQGWRDTDAPALQAAQAGDEAPPNAEGAARASTNAAPSAEGTPNINTAPSAEGTPNINTAPSAEGTPNINTAPNAEGAPNTNAAPSAEGVAAPGSGGPASAKPTAPTARSAARGTKGNVTITGLVRITEPNGAFLRANAPADNRWYSRDVEAITNAQHLADAAPYFVDAEAAPGVAPDFSRPPVPGLTVVHFRNSHLQYAITWFALALMALVLGVRVARTR
jgi:cytochrome oxidase assembly protein ShyY1